MRLPKRLGFECLESRVLLHGNPASGITEPDVDGDGRVDVFDVNLVSARWGSPGPVADADGNGTVDILDANLISERFGDALPHSTDSVKQSEHFDLLALVNRADATAVAHESGLWSDPDIWVDGRVPTAGDKVLIPRGVAVTIDQVTTDGIAWIRVDGTLEFAADRDTQLIVDTLIGTTTAVLRINTPRPFTTRIVIADRGPIDTTWDPHALSRGIVWHGAATIHGAEIAPIALAAGDLVAGQQQFTVDNTSGWTVGDRLLIAGLDHDDVRIASIDENTVTVDRPLAFDHLSLDGHPPVIENLTRTVVVTSENAVDVSRRGHVMFMHNPDVVVANAAFENLGRTRKDVPVTDPDGAGDGLENVRGRYALHFHRTGFDHAVEVSGVTVIEPTSWGVVNHESWVNVHDATVTGAFGAAFVTETGNELGTFTRSTAIDVGGVSRTGQADQDLAVLFGGVPNNDRAFSGHGFWMASRKVTLVDNYVAGANDFAYELFGNDISRNHLFTFTGNENAASSGLALDIWDGPQLLGLDLATQSQVVGNILRGRIDQGYTGHIDFVDNAVIGPGIRPANEYGPYTVGITHTGVNFDTRWINNTVTGWWTGQSAGTEGTQVIQGGYYDNLGTNIVVQNTQQDRTRTLAIDAVVFGDQARWNVEMSPGFFSYDFRPAYESYPWKSYESPPPLGPLWTRESLGASSVVTYNGQRLYFDVQAADFSWDLLRYPQFKGKTTADLWNDLHLAVSNMVVPDDAYQLPGIRGRLSASEPIVLSDLKLLSPKASSRLSDYVAHVRDTSGHDAFGQSTNLQPGQWNVVTVIVDGFQRGVQVFGVDRASVESHWGSSALEGDANSDGKVDIFDVNTLSMG